MEDVYVLLVALSLLVMLSYLLDLIAHKINFPSILLLIAAGIGIKEVSLSLGWHIYNFNNII